MLYPWRLEEAFSHLKLIVLIITCHFFTFTANIPSQYNTKPSARNCDRPKTRKAGQIIKKHTSCYNDYLYDIIIQKEWKMFFILSRAWDKEKNSESLWGIEPQTFGFRAPMLYYWATSVMFVDIIRKMVSSELGKEIVKYISHLVTMVVSFGTRNFFFVSRSWQDEKCLSLQLFTSLSRASFNLNVYYFF